MTQNPRITILALFLPEKGGHPRIRQRRLIESLACAARWFNADLHVLFSQATHESAKVELERLREHTLRGGISIIEHLTGDDLVQPLIDLAKDVSADYLCFADGGVGDCRSPEDRIKQQILMHSSIPVLVLPHRIRRHFRQFGQIVVPLSGERRQSAALKEALRIAQSMDRTVTLLHVRHGDPSLCEASGMETLGDQAHHEYKRQLDQVISEASPDSSLLERKRITRLAHLSGSADEAITKFIRKIPDSLLVIEWKASLSPGRAMTFRNVLKSAGTPLLVVKISEEAQSRLKIDEEFGAA